MQRLVPGATVPFNDASGYHETRAQEEKRLADLAQARADARRLLPEEIEEVGELDALMRPVRPGLILGNGPRKLLDAVDRLGSSRNGAPSGYKREAGTALPSFVLGSDPADPDGRISVTADGLLEVTRAIRTQTKARKGRPATTTTSYKTVLVDLFGTKVDVAGLAKRKTPLTVAEYVLAQARSGVEKEAQQLALGGLRNSTALVAGGDPANPHLTLAELVAEADPAVYLQRGYTGEDNRQTELLKKVMAAFDQIRAEFEAFKPPKYLALAGFSPSHETLARAFAAKLQPTLFMTAAAAQSELDQSTAALAAAEAEVASANAAYAALKAGKPTKEDKKAAQTRQRAAGKGLEAAQALVKKHTAARDGLAADRDAWATTIAWILDPTTSTENRAAKTVGSLCNVLSFFLYGKAVGVVPAETDFKATTSPN